MTGTDDLVARYVLEALEAAEEPLSPGRLQQRIAANGLDATTGAIRDACESLREAGEIETVGESASRKYQIRK
jgi:hypothetical protein